MMKNSPVGDLNESQAIYTYIYICVCVRMFFLEA